MKKYITVKEAADNWGVSNQQVCILCREGKVEGAQKERGQWVIPATSSKPIDGRKTRIHKRKHDPDAKFRYIDLFAGVGGFHQAMDKLKGECIMAAEINQACVETYTENFKTYEGYVRGDVNKINPKDIPEFDVVCAGFPCQPFSKAGLQKGFEDETRGNLFYKIMDILDDHPEAKYVVLENVRNLADKTENWAVIQEELSQRDFLITKEPLILSPSDFRIPQIRERVYILGIKKDECNEKIREQGYITKEDLNLSKYLKKCRMGDALSILEENAPDEYVISEEQTLMINAWDEFRIATGIGVIGFPLWIHCFGVGENDTEKVYQNLEYYDMPKWKQKYVEKNRKFYLEHRNFIDAWIVRYNMLDRIRLYQKFEWNCGTDVTDIKNAIIQVRQSGIRVKRTTFFPSLVAIVNTPIIWDAHKNAYRHITPREAANLQNFKKSYKFKGTDQQIYKQLGNSVNVKVVKILCENLFKLSK